MSGREFMLGRRFESALGTVFAIATQIVIQHQATRAIDSHQF
jgi:hypothetical protein